MLKNKKTKGRLHFTCKTKKAGSQGESVKDLTPLKAPADGNVLGAGPEPRIISQSQQSFPDRVYLLASVIFQNNHQEKPAAHRLVNYGKVRELPLPKVKDKEMQRSAFELAFSALKYPEESASSPSDQELLEGIMIDSCIHLSRPVPEDQMSLVAVMLFDFQDRKFLPRKSQGEEEIVQEVRAVEKYLLRSKTKLAASMARCRIKNDLLSIECILPETVKKKQERSINLPLHAWVNTQKTSFDEVQSLLSSAGFSQVKSVELLEGPSFCYDPHCGDTLVFPAQLKAQLNCTKLLSDHKLIIQDKSCSLGPNAACSLLPEEGDILMVGCFSGLTVSHTASLIAQKHKANSNSQSVVYVCVSNCTDAQREELQLTVSTMGCKNVKLMLEDFHSLDSGDKRLQKVRVILLIPRCSMSAVNNPVDFMLQENEDINLLQDLSHGSIAKIKLESLVAQQRKDIDHALKFPMVLGVVYSTCSSYPEENVDVVTRALQQAKACSDQEGEPKQANFRPHPSRFNTSDHGEPAEETEPFFLLEPSEHSSGCFLAVLNREEVLLAVRDQIGHGNIVFASRMNKAVAVFVSDENQVPDLIGKGVFIGGAYVQVSPLSVPSTRITVSGVPPFIANEQLEKELSRFGKFASKFKTQREGGAEAGVANVSGGGAGDGPSAETDVGPAAGSSDGVAGGASEFPVAASLSEPVIQEAPQEVIARANAKGILDRIGSNHLTRNGHTKRMKKTAHVRSSSEPHLSFSRQSKGQQTKGSSSASLSGDQDLMNLQSSRGKPKAQRLQALKTTVSRSFSNSKQESTSSTSSKTETSQSPTFTSTTTPTTATLHAACPPATTVAPTLRPRRAQQELMKRVVLVLPTITFPNSVPPQLTETELSPASLDYNKWKTSALDRCRPLF
ncbi:putative methyltransferase NSUN7 [Xenentodon cancila]